jgi:hypothetical protein
MTRPAMQVRLVLATVLSGACAATAQAAPSQVLSYTYFKGDEPIGRETVSITGAGGQAIVQVTTDTRVKVLFLDFHYHHQRTETWVDGRLERLVADTDDDGSIHHIEVHPDGGAVHAVADGKAEELPADALPLTLWGKVILDRPVLYSIIDAQPYKVTVTRIGTEPLRLGGREVTTEHYRMTGDVERDLWYGADGMLVKAAFERRGYRIRVVRE